MNKILSVMILLLATSTAEAQIGPNWTFKPQPRIWVQRPIVKKRRFGRVVMHWSCIPDSSVQFRKAAYE